MPPAATPSPEPPPDCGPARSGVTEEGELALVMSGGGARAAYQVGFLRCLANAVPGLHVPVLTGTSAGAINAAFLAADQGTFAERVERLTALWTGLDVGAVFSVGALGLFTQVLRWGASLLSGGLLPLQMRGMVDTSPLRALLAHALHADARGVAPGIARNLERGELKALALTAASYTTGQSVTWVQGRRIQDWERVHRVGRETRIGVDHVLASAALPLFFPAVRVDGAWYGDGGMRQTAPLSPAVHLGADKVLAISTRHAATRRQADEPQVSGYPPPERVVGMLLNALFLDQLDGDALRLERINALLGASPPEAHRGLRPLRLLVLRPSEDLGRLANEFEAELPRTFRWLTRGMGTRHAHANDFLSLVMFQPDYLRRLIRLGEHDAESRRDEILRFLEAPPPAR